MPKQLRIDAEWILPVSSAPIKMGSVIVDRGKIEYVGEKASPSIDAENKFGGQNLLLIPGLVNAHTHLELTAMGGDIGKELSFTQWIREVIYHRKNIPVSDIISSISSGTEMLLKSGSTCVGEFSGTGLSLDIIKRFGLKGRMFLEFTGFHHALSEETLNGLKKKVLPYLTIPDQSDIGIAPHAPYSVSGQLLRTTYRFAQKNKLPYSMHIAETEDESELLLNGAGPLVDLLKELEVWDESWKHPQTSPVKYLSNLGVLKGMTGVHLNLLDKADIKLLKENECSVVFCPGSRKWFGWKNCCPLMELQSKGINLCLGTDGLSSNADLNMLREVRLVREMFPEIKSDQILKMATLNGARSLGIKNIGALTPGWAADMVGLKITKNYEDPYQSLFDINTKVAFVIIEGKIMYTQKENGERSGQRQ